MTMFITKAGGLSENVEIWLISEPPRFETLADQQVWFQAQAKELGDTLASHLPGGTFDRLVAYLLQKTASYLIVSHERKAGA